MASNDRKKFVLPHNIPVPRNSRQVYIYLEETNARLVSDLIPTCEITESFPLRGDRLDSIAWMNEPYPDEFAAYVLVDMEKDKENSWFTRLYFAKESDLLGFKQAFPSTTDLSLPDELVDIEVLWAEDKGEGSSTSDWTGAAVGTNISLTGNEDGTAQSSVSIAPELAINTRHIWGKSLSTVMYYFILPTTAGIVTENDVINGLRDLFSIEVTTWPVFKPASFVIALYGGKVSVQAGARANERVAIGSSETSYSITTGQSSGLDVSHSTAVRTISNVLTGGFTVNEAKVATVEANAAVGWPAATNWYAVGVTKSVLGDISAEVRGTIEATTPTEVPKDGLYLLNLQVKPFTNFRGYVMVNAEVLDASIFA